MFRFLKPKPRASILTLSRLPLRLESRVEQGLLRRENVHKVQFKADTRIWPQVRRIGIVLFTLSASWAIYSKLVISPLAQKADEIEQQLPPMEEDEEDEEEYMGVFIPFPGTTQEIKPRPYRGNDPEWQEFIKFSLDKELTQRTRDTLAQHVRQTAQAWPMLTIRCGNDMKIRRSWLDVDFPTHPPPEFMRSGLEISDDYISWTTAPVDSLVVFKNRQILWPAAAIQSGWSFIKVMLVDDIKRLGTRLGFDMGKPPPTMEEILAHHQNVIAQHQRALKAPPKNNEHPNQKAVQPQPIGDAKSTMSAALPQKPPVANPENDTPGAKPEEDNETAEETMKRTKDAIYAHYFRGFLAARQTFQQKWKQPRAYPPRGSILIGGLVELDAPKAWLVFDVKAAWDPKTREFDAASMNLRLRRIQMKKQGPLSR